jgi:hypothetical protein
VRGSAQELERALGLAWKLGLELESEQKLALESVLELTLGLGSELVLGLLLLLSLKSYLKMTNLYDCSLHCPRRWLRRLLLKLL